MWLLFSHFHFRQVYTSISDAIHVLEAVGWATTVFFVVNDVGEKEGPVTLESY